MSKYARYPEYKDSGVPWLGEIPSHWQIMKNKFILNFSKGLSITKENLLDEGIPCVNYGEVHSKYGFEVAPEKHSLKYVAQSYLTDSPNALLRQGDFIFADTSEDVKGSGNFTYINSNIPTFAGYHTVIAKLSGNEIIPRFLAYVFESDSHRNQVRAMVKGVKVYSITQAFLKNTFAWIPPKDEQNLIVNFLDTELGKIDALIDKQQLLLDKLAEQRSAVITQAVTKGLNPNAEMKDSGVVWLGDVPSHWVVLSIKRLSQVKRGASPRPIDNPEYFDDEGEYAWVRIADVTASDKYLLTTTQKLSDYGKSFSIPLEPNSIFLSIAGSVGKPMITKIKACIHDGFVYFPEWKESIDFLYYIFASGQPYLGLGKLGTQLNLNSDTVGAIKIGLPPLSEQIQIVDFIDQETQKIDQMTETVNRTIERLKEYRSTLITQAVTGKIDVRHHNNNKQDV